MPAPEGGLGAEVIAMRDVTRWFPPEQVWIAELLGAVCADGCGSGRLAGAAHLRLHNPHASHGSPYLSSRASTACSFPHRESLAGKTAH